MTAHDPEMMEAARQAVLAILATIKGEDRTLWAALNQHGKAWALSVWGAMRVPSLAG